MSNSISLEYLNSRLAGVSISAVTQQALGVQNTSGSTLVVLLGGTAVPLPAQLYMNGFTANRANTQFTVQNTGTYFIIYEIALTGGLLLSSSLYQNGKAISNLTRSPAVSLSSYSCSAILPLTTGDVLQLTLYGLLGTAVLSSGVGAYLNIIRIY